MFIIHVIAMTHMGIPLLLQFRMNLYDRNYPFYFCSFLVQKWKFFEFDEIWYSEGVLSPYQIFIKFEELLFLGFYSLLGLVTSRFFSFHLLPWTKSWTRSNTLLIIFIFFILCWFYLAWRLFKCLCLNTVFTFNDH